MSFARADLLEKYVNWRLYTWIYELTFELLRHLNTRSHEKRKRLEDKILFQDGKRSRTVSISDEESQLQALTSSNYYNPGYENFAAASLTTGSKQWPPQDASLQFENTPALSSVGVQHKTSSNHLSYPPASIEHSQHHPNVQPRDNYQHISDFNHIELESPATGIGIPRNFLALSGSAESDSIASSEIFDNPFSSSANPVYMAQPQMASASQSMSIMSSIPYPVNSSTMMSSHDPPPIENPFASNHAWQLGTAFWSSHDSTYSHDIPISPTTLCHDQQFTDILGIEPDITKTKIEPLFIVGDSNKVQSKILEPGEARVKATIKPEIYNQHNEWDMHQKLQDTSVPIPVSIIQEPLNEYKNQSSASEFERRRNLSHNSAIGSGSGSIRYQLSPEPVRKRKQCYIGHDTQQSMLHVLTIMDGQKGRSALFTQERLTGYLELFWNKFDPIYPFIHAATFVADKAQPELLVAMVTVGMGYCHDSTVYELATDIHRKFRNILLIMMEDQPQFSLWVHQCLLLTNFFVTNLGTESQHETSQVFHGIAISHLKLSGYLTTPKDPATLADEPITHEYWQRWVECESKKRATFFAFICDTKNATLFKNAQLMSAFEISLELPSSDACWNSKSIDEFERACKLQPRQIQKRQNPNLNTTDTEGSKAAGSSGRNDQRHLKNKNSSNNSVSSSGIRGEGNWPTMIFSIRRMMAPYHEAQKEYSPECFSQFSRLILLYGLLSIWWDVQRRGLLDIGLVPKRRFGEFRIRMMGAIKNWEGYFDFDSKGLNASSSTNTTNLSNFSSEGSSKGTKRVGSEGSHRPGFVYNYYGNSPLLYTNWALYQISQVTLYINFSALRLFADGISSNSYAQSTMEKARRESLTGYDSSISINDRLAAQSLEQLKAQKVISIWASSDDASSAAWHSAQFLAVVFRNANLLDQVGKVAWCMFLTTLTLWAYEVTRPDANPPLFSSSRYIRKQFDQFGQEEKTGQTDDINSSSSIQIQKTPAFFDSINYLDSIIQNSPGSSHAASSTTATTTTTSSSTTTPPENQASISTDGYTPPYSSPSSPQSAPELLKSRLRSTVAGRHTMEGRKEERLGGNVMGLVAYSYYLLKGRDRGVNKSAISVLARIVKRYERCEDLLI